jgi:hypothetical protein
MKYSGEKITCADFKALRKITALTVDPVKVDERTRSKWSRVLRYAMEYKAHPEPLDQFIKRKGGINKCAARFARCLGRFRPKRNLS